MSSVYINPRIDFAFKRLFGSTKNEDVLIGFLNAVLYAGVDQIQTVQILNPYVQGETRSDKETYVDVRAKLDDGREVLIEMQMLNVGGFAQRVLYNAAKAYGSQLNRRGDYLGIHAVIGLTITNFKLFNDEAKWHTHFIFREATSGMNYPGDNNIELVFVELPKFNIKHANLARKEDQWALFLKEGEMLDQVTQDYLMTDPVIKRAFENLERAQLNGAERYELEAREIWLHDRITEKIYDRAQGRAEGHAEGHAEGRSEGRAEALLQMTLMQLTYKFGSLSDPLEDRVKRLKLTQLEQLIKDLLKFTTVADLQLWLDAVYNQPETIK